MSIIYTKISEKKQRKGVEVHCEFVDSDTYKVYNKTLLFDNNAQIINEFDLRMVKCIQNIQDDIDFIKEPTIDDKMDAIEKMKIKSKELQDILDGKLPKSLKVGKIGE